MNSLASTGSLTIDGEMSGYVEMGANCAGDVFVGDELSGLLVIGGDLASGGTIDIDTAAGLLGQIIINADNDSSSWDGTVSIDATSLTARGYSNTAASLGGGSVGVVGYEIHHEDCTPINMDTETGAFADALVRFYGPVTWDDEEMPFTIERGTFGTGGNWTDVTSQFEVDDGDQGENVIQVLSKFGSQFKPAYRYRITPIRSGDDRLECDGLLEGGPEPVADTALEFDVEAVEGS